MAVLRGCVAVLFLASLGCSAQSALSPDLTHHIQREVRSYYNVPASVKISVGAPQASDFPKYDALTITMEGAGKKLSYDFLLAKDGKELIRVTKLDLTKDPYAEIVKKINIAGRPTRGNKDAKVVVVSYDDFECPFCSRMHSTLFPEILKEYQDKVLFVYKDFPLYDIHPWATRAAVDANCLAAQNNDAYWDFADYIHAHQRDVSADKDHAAAVDHLAMQQSEQHHLDSARLQSCMKAQNEDAIKASEKEAESVGVSATPTMFVNGQELDGAMPASEVRAALDNALQQAGGTPPVHPAPTAAVPAAAQPASN